MVSWLTILLHPRIFVSSWIGSEEVDKGGGSSSSWFVGPGCHLKLIISQHLKTSELRSGICQIWVVVMFGYSALSSIVQQVMSWPFVGGFHFRVIVDGIPYEWILVFRHPAKELACLIFSVAVLYTFTSKSTLL